MKSFWQEVEAPEDRVRLVVYSDVHDGSAQCAENHFMRMLARESKIPHTYFLSNGDNTDCIVPADSKRYDARCVAPWLHGKKALLDAQVEKHVARLKAHIDPKFHLGIGEGNHEAAAVKYHASNAARRIATDFGVPYLGYSCYMTLIVRGSCTNRKVVIYRHHGYGAGARTEGGDITKFSKKGMFYDADVMIFGHTHKLWTHEMDRIVPQERPPYSVVARPYVIVNPGSFLKTLSEDDDASYSEVAGYDPVPLGYAVVEIVLAHRNGNKAWTCEIKAHTERFFGDL